MKYFHLIDYKGKFDIIADRIGDYDIKVGSISREDAIKEADSRRESASYYGVPAYIGDDEYLNAKENEYKL